MLKVIIADDEQLVTEVLQAAIPWNELGLEVAGIASDGMEAFELCVEIKPDILITDIRMPKMDGLELALKLEENNIDTKIVFISGHQDFNYVKTALDLNAEGYILKPIKMDEVKMVMQKVIRSINIARNKEQIIQQLKTQLHSDMEITCSRFLYSLLEGYYTNEKEIWDKFSYFRLPFNTSDCFMVSVIAMDDCSNLGELAGEQDKHLLSFAILDIMNEAVKKSGIGICLSKHDKEFIVIFRQSNHSNEIYMDTLKDISSAISNVLNISVSIGIGYPVANVSQLNISYKKALDALQYKYYTGCSSIIDINDVESAREADEEALLNSGFNIYKFEEQLMSHMRVGDDRNASAIINEIYDNLNLTYKYSHKYIQSISIQLVSMASRTIFEMGGNIADIFSNFSDIIINITSMQNIFQLKNYMLEIFQTIARHFQEKNNRKSKNVVSIIRSYIQNNYAESIGVSEIADEVGLTPNYVSQIFKQEAGETITEFLTKTRMEKAIEYMISTDLKIMDISEMVGYENQHYFSAVFKKYTGISPQRYRALK